MNKYVKEFLHRGMMYAGFGPVICGIVYFILSKTIVGFTLTGGQVLLAIVSTYLLAFIQAGASVFNQMYHWPLLKSAFWHFVVLYTAYISCYLVNTWIAFDFRIIVNFTLIFLAIYLVVWLSVFITVKTTSKKLNKKLK